MSVKANSNRVYSVIARFYDFGLWIFGYKLAVGYFIRLLPFLKTDSFKVLDAGCGTGLYTFALLQRFPRATVQAFDINTDMAERMKITTRRKNLGNQVLVFNGDVIKSLPIQPEQFDLIITGGVLEYVNFEEAVKNLAPYLKPGGYFLNSPVKDNMLGRMVGKLYGFRPHSRAVNIDAFASNGFTLKRTRSFPIIKEAHLFQMFQITKSKDSKLLECLECGLHYTDKVWADKCQEWCREHHSCNLEITKHAVENQKIE